MSPEPLVSRILDDEGLTAGLDAEAAGTLVAWLVARAEHVAATTATAAAARKQVEDLCRRGRGFAEAVAAEPSAGQTAALQSLLDTERP